MSSHEDGGAAFPRAGFLSEMEEPQQVIARFENTPQPGMSLRDWFAGRALTGILASNYTGGAAKWVPEKAYALADAMLAARARESAE